MTTIVLMILILLVGFLSLMVLTLYEQFHRLQYVVSTLIHAIHRAEAEKQQPWEGNHTP